MGEYDIVEAEFERIHTLMSYGERGRTEDGKGRDGWCDHDDDFPGV